MSQTRLWMRVGLLCIAGGTGNALAADASPAKSAAPSAHDRQASATVMAEFGPAVSAAALGHYSGGSTAVANENLTGTVSGNTASHVATGNNSIAGDSFAGASGLPSVIQNTGNNVLIQNGVIVNVQMKP